MTGNALRDGLDGCHNDGGALRGAEIGEFAGGAERRQPVYPGLDQVVAELAEHIGLDPAVGCGRRDEIGKHAVQVLSHVCALRAHGASFSLALGGRRR